MISRAPLSLLCLVQAAISLAAVATGQELADVAVPADVFRFRGHVIDDSRADGWVTARGETYKLEAQGTRFTVLGLFGADAPSMPVSFHLDAARIGETDGKSPVESRIVCSEDRLEVDHGAVVERWRVMDRSLEQSFVFERAVVQRGARLAIDVDTDLPMESDRDGIIFRAGEHGCVRYRDFVVTDAIGQRRSLPIQLDGRQIVLEATPAELAGLIEPIVFDPTITFVGIRLGSTRAKAPDVAMDPIQRRIAVCYEEVVSSNDSDVMLAHLTNTGTVVTQFALDNRSVQTVRPRIANSLRGLVFAVVWRQIGGAAPDRIEARRIATSDMTALALQTLRTAASGTEFADADIGGSISEVDTRFLVAFGIHNDGVFPSNSGVFLISLAADGNTTSMRALDSDTGCTNSPQVAVSRHGGSLGQFGVVYSQKRGCLNSSTDVAFAVVNSTTTPVFGPTLVTSNSGADQRPDVSADDNRWFVVFDRLSSSNDVIGAAYRFGNGVFTRSFGPAVLSALEPGVNVALSQSDAAVDFDGCRFTYAYRESGTGPRVRTATFALSSDGSAIDFSAGHESITGNDGDVFSTPRLAFGASEVSRCFVTWTGGVNNTDEDVVGALIDVAGDGFPPFSTVPTGCGTRGIPRTRVVLGGGLAVIGRPITLLIEPGDGTVAMLIGLVASTPLPLCGGGIAPCLLGVDPILSASLGSAQRIPVPCDPNLVGAPLAVQAVDFFVSGGCGATVFGVPLAVSDTLIVRLL